MRKFAVLAIGCALLFLSPPTLSGQTSLGFHGGLSMATLDGSGLEDMDPGYRNGFGLGAFLEVAISDKLSIQPELLYLQKGASESSDGVDITFGVDFVEIPVLLRIDVPTDGSIAPYFLIGPAIGFKTGCEISAEGDGLEINVDCDEAEATIKSMDFGGVAGAGLSIAAGSGNIHLGARYNYGLMSLDDSDLDEDVKSRAFSFLAGYSFPLGG
jgi:opacity protein-like surface antigen